MKSKFSASAVFYLGTFISSFGSLLFVMCTPAFFINAGYSLKMIGTTIGIHRFAGIAALAWFGPKIDKHNARNVVFITEFLAGISSIGLFLSWVWRDQIGLMPFWFFVGTRSITVGVQGSSRNRLIKLLTKENQNREATFTIWLNKVTQGAMVFSSLVAIPLVTNGSLIHAIILDAISFIIGGISALWLPDLDKKENKESVQSFNVVSSILKLIRIHKSTFFQDQLLALAVSGSILFLTKLSGSNSTYVIYFNLLFGSCIWASSLFAHRTALRELTIPYWFMMLGGFVALFFVADSLWRFPAYFLTYMGYWILFHKYTVEIQLNTPKEQIGAIMAARGLAVAFTLSTGEMFGGYINQVLNFRSELLLRSGICLAAILGVILISKKNKLESP